MTPWLWIAVTLMSGHSDALQLAAHADSAGVPLPVALAVAWQESRSGAKGNAYRGREDERGRFQLHPRGSWRRTTYGDARCTLLRVTRSYDDNLHCGLRHLAALARNCGSWSCAIERYNGRGPRARAYRERALAYIGRLSLGEVPP